VFSRPQRRAAAGVIGCKGQIRVYSLQVGVPAQAKPATEAKPAESKKRSSLLPLIAGIVALIVIAAGAWYFLGANRPAQAAHLSIVVLPFTNLSGDPAQGGARRVYANQRAFLAPSPARCLPRLSHCPNGAFFAASEAIRLGFEG
jgi:hypothetical protein